jgi:hypothetical protein
MNKRCALIARFTYRAGAWTLGVLLASAHAADTGERTDPVDPACLERTTPPERCVVPDSTRATGIPATPGSYGGNSTTLAPGTSISNPMSPESITPTPNPAPSTPGATPDPVLPPVGSPTAPNPVLPPVGSPTPPNPVLPPVGTPAPPNSVLPPVSGSTSTSPASTTPGAAPSGAQAAPSAPTPHPGSPAPAPSARRRSGK